MTLSLVGRILPRHLTVAIRALWSTSAARLKSRHVVCALPSRDLQLTVWATKPASNADMFGVDDSRLCICGSFALRQPVGAGSAAKHRSVRP